MVEGDPHLQEQVFAQKQGAAPFIYTHYSGICPNDQSSSWEMCFIGLEPGRLMM